MKTKFIFWIMLAIWIGCCGLQNIGDTKDTEANSIFSCFTRLDRLSKWLPVDTVKLDFCTYHPQGLVKVGAYFYLSAVETIIAPEKFDTPVHGYDRSPGKGTGHFFKFNQDGQLLATITLGQGTMYHPGGIDFDGHQIWVPVAEYRPNSCSIIYRIDPTNLEPVKVFVFNDHIGALVSDTRRSKLHGVSWGSRKFYAWKLDARFAIKKTGETPVFTQKINGSHYIDYQDCHFVPDHYMLCSGLAGYAIPNSGKFTLGGLELVDLEQQVAIHQIPVPLWLSPELPMTRNPFYVTRYQEHLRFYFVPEDEASCLYIYDVMD